MSFVFGFLSIVVYDSVTSGLGIWTIVTALAYGFIGLGAQYFFKNRSGVKSYLSFAVLYTLFYDAITGLTIGPLFFHQSFSVSFVGQIPFTFLHLLGNVAFAMILSPVIEKWFVKSSDSLAVKSLEKVCVL